MKNHYFIKIIKVVRYYWSLYKYLFVICINIMIDLNDYYNLAIKYKK
jgi:hypothetical protein